MRSPSGLAVATPLPTKALSDGWVIPLSLDEPARVLPDCVRWTERGPFRCFFHGLLFDRETLAQSTDCSHPDCSDAELVLRVYERRGEAALSGLRGSFVVAIIDRARNTAVVARDPMGTHPLFYVETRSSVLIAETPQPLLHWHGASRACNRAALSYELCPTLPGT